MRVPALVLTLAAAPAAAEVPLVVTDTPVVHSLASQVMGDLGEPTVIVEPGSDEHSFQLRPSQAAALADASLVFWVGEELTPWLSRALETTSGTATTIALLDVPGVTLIDYGDGTGAHGHEDHGHDDHGHDDAEHDDHAHAGIDPHAWLYPDNAKVWISAIAAALAAADPANAATYAANAEAANLRIDAAVAQAAETLAPAHDRPIVVFHDAYGYFARAFDVEIAGSIALGDAAAPGAQRLRDLQQTIGDEKIACVFREPQHDASIAESVAADAGVGIGTLDPSGTSLTYGPALYETLITSLATNIADCVAAAR